MHWRNTLTRATLIVALKKVRGNAHRVASRLCGIETVAVAKVFCGNVRFDGGRPR